MFREKLAAGVPFLALWLLRAALLLAVVTAVLAVIGGPGRELAGAALGCLLSGLMLKVAVGWPER